MSLSSLFQHCYALGPYTLFQNDLSPRSESGELVYRAKYKKDEAAIGQLSSRILELVDSHPVLSSSTAVASPPSSDPRSPGLPLIWAKFVAGEMNWRLLDTFKTRETPPQKNIAKEIEESDAELGLKNSVSVSNVNDGDKVLILDDTIGSGATLKEVARALLTANAACVYGVAAAKDARHTYGGLKLDKDAWQ